MEIQEETRNQKNPGSVEAREEPQLDYLKIKEQERVDFRTLLPDINIRDAAFVFKDQNSFLVIIGNSLRVISESKIVYEKKGLSLIKDQRSYNQSIYAKSIDSYIVDLDGVIYTKFTTNSQPPKFVWNLGRKRTSSTYHLIFSEKLNKIFVSYYVSSAQYFAMVDLKNMRSHHFLIETPFPVDNCFIMAGGQDERFVFLNLLDVLVYSYRDRKILDKVPANEKSRPGQRYRNQLHQPGGSNQFFVVSACSDKRNCPVDLIWYEIKNDQISVRKKIELAEQPYSWRSIFLDIKGISGNQFDIFGIVRYSNHMRREKRPQIIDFSTGSGCGRQFNLNWQAAYSIDDLLNSTHIVLTFNNNLWLFLRKEVLIQVELSLAKRSEGDTTEQFASTMKGIIKD